MFDTSEYQTAMESSLAKFKDDMKKVRTGRAHPDMLAGIKVEAYGQWMPLNQVANITVSGGTMLLVTPYDPSTIPAISNAIRSDSTLGLNPSDDGRVVRVPIPPLTEERRKDLIKVVRHETEEARVAVRNIRRDANNELKNLLKDKEISEDDNRRGEESIQKLTDKYIAEMDKILEAKEKDLMEV